MLASFLAVALKTVTAHIRVGPELSKYGANSLANKFVVRVLSIFERLAFGHGIIRRPIMSVSISCCRDRRTRATHHSLVSVCVEVMTMSYSLKADGFFAFELP